MSFLRAEYQKVVRVSSTFRAFSGRAAKADSTVGGGPLVYKVAREFELTALRHPVRDVRHSLPRCAKSARARVHDNQGGLENRQLPASRRMSLGFSPPATHPVRFAPMVLGKRNRRLITDENWVVRLHCINIKNQTESSQL